MVKSQGQTSELIAKGITTISVASLVKVTEETEKILTRNKIKTKIEIFIIKSDIPPNI